MAVQEGTLTPMIGDEGGLDYAQRLNTWITLSGLNRVTEHVAKVQTDQIEIEYYLPNHPLFKIMGFQYMCTKVCTDIIFKSLLHPNEVNFSDLSFFPVFLESLIITFSAWSFR